MPYGSGDASRDLSTALRDAASPEGRPSSQSAPLLVSTHGRFIGAEDAFSFRFVGDELVVDGDGLRAFSTGGGLRDAFLAASHEFFPPSGAHPALEMFTTSQYNTWIETPYRPTQVSVLAYAERILAAWLEAGLLIIDDAWAPDYGTWSFDEARFPDPSAMIRQLHEWGFSVMLWLVPFVSPDSAAFRELEKDGLLVRDSDGGTAIRRWWNGFSALLDLSHPRAIAWLVDQLDALREVHGVDGFKFDGGDVRDFRPDDLTHGGLAPTDMSEAWGRVGLRYPFNEFRACWKLGGEPLAQRLQDKPPSWDEEGIGALIPEMLAQGMIGHPYVCPDMIGGGEIGAVSDQSGVDQEFFVRYAQVAAFSPMTQFSLAPTRVLDDEHLAAVRSALDLRSQLMPDLIGLVEHAASTGEPVLRPMAYHAADLDDVRDQFFVGPDLIVAPVLQPGQLSREVRVPSGLWVSPDGLEITGPATVAVPCMIHTVPRFRRADSEGQL